MYVHPIEYSTLNVHLMYLTHSVKYCQFNTLIYKSKWHNWQRARLKNRRLQVQIPQKKEIQIKKNQNKKI